MERDGVFAFWGEEEGLGRSYSDNFAFENMEG